MTFLSFGAIEFSLTAGHQPSLNEHCLARNIGPTFHYSTSFPRKSTLYNSLRQKQRAQRKLILQLLNALLRQIPKTKYISIQSVCHLKHLIFLLESIFFSLWEVTITAIVRQHKYLPSRPQLGWEDPIPNLQGQLNLCFHPDKNAGRGRLPLLMYNSPGQAQISVVRICYLFMAYTR